MSREHFLAGDEIGEVGVGLKVLLEIGEKARPYLSAVERQGPPSAVVDEFSRGLAESWKGRLSFLDSKEARVLGEKSNAMMRAITREQYEKNQQAALEAKYRQRAGLALRALAGAGKR